MAGALTYLAQSSDAWRWWRAQASIWRLEAFRVACDPKSKVGPGERFKMKPTDSTRVLWWFNQVQHAGWTSPPCLSPCPQCWLPQIKRHDPLPSLSMLFVCIGFFGKCVLLCMIKGHVSFIPWKGRLFLVLFVFSPVWPWLISWVMKRPTLYQFTSVCGPLAFFLHPQQQIKRSNRSPLQRPLNIRFTKASADWGSEWGNTINLGRV